MSTVVFFYEGIGVLVKEDILDIRWVALLMSGMTRDYWERLAPYVSNIRDALDRPRFVIEWEYLYNELMKYIEEQPELYPNR